MQIKKKRHAIFFLVSLVVLTLLFSDNIFKTVEDSRFYTSQRKSESLVTGRLMRSEKEGIFSHSGFLGWNHPYQAGDTPPEMRFNGWGYEVPGHPNKYHFQYDAYEQKLDINHYELYYSQSGGQSIIYSLIGKLFGISGDMLVSVCNFLNAFLTAFVLSLFLWWGAKHFGLFAAIFTLVIVLFLQWPIVFAKNMLYITSLFYVPFVAMLLYLDCGKQYYHHGKAMMIVFGSILLKCVLAGFDFMTPTLVMAVLPWFYYGIKQEWPVKQWLIRTSTVSLVAVGAVALSLAALFVQLSVEKGSASAAMDYIVWTAERRAHGNADELAKVSSRTQNVSLSSILSNYINDYGIDLTHVYRGIFQGLKVKFGYFFTVFILASVAALFMKNLNKGNLNALLVITWLSLAGPISWFVIFKEHAITHTTMNQVIWQMPFMLLGCLLTGYVLKGIFHFVVETIRNKFSVKTKEAEQTS